MIEAIISELNSVFVELGFNRLIKLTNHYAASYNEKCDIRLYFEPNDVTVETSNGPANLYKFYYSDHDLLESMISFIQTTLLKEL